MLYNLYSGANKYNYFDYNSTDYEADYTSPPYSWCLQTSFETTHKKRLNWGLEMMYAEKHVKISAYYGGLGTQNERVAGYRLNYIYLTPGPVFSAGKKLKLKISAGPTIGFLASSQRQGTHRIYNSNLWDTADFLEGKATADFKKNEIRATAKIGLEYVVDSRWVLGLNHGYSLGIVTAAKGAFGSYANFLNTKDIYLTLGLGYRINKPVFRTSVK